MSRQTGQQSASYVEFVSQVAGAAEYASGLHLLVARSEEDQIAAMYAHTLPRSQIITGREAVGSKRDFAYNRLLDLATKLSARGEYQAG